LEGQLREMEELRRRNEELKMEVRHKEEEIVELRRPRRSAEFDAILRELNELRYELDRVSFDPILL
jgi:Tfp pilus assembly protein PilO